MSLLGLWHPTGPSAADVEVWTSSAAIDAGAGRLTAGGVAWVVVGPAQRGAAERALRRAGLVVAEHVLMVPRWPATAHLVPLAPGPLRDAGVRHLGLSPRQARVLARLAASRATRLLLSRAARGCGIVAVRPSAEQPLHWLGAIDGAGVATATLSQSSRDDARVAVALRFAPGTAVPDLAAKLALDAAGSARVDAERRALLELGPAARAAGAAVPAPSHAEVKTEDPAAGRMLVTAALSGSPASALLRRRPDRVSAVLLALSDWLLAWNRSTAATSIAGDALLERRLLGPAARIAEAIPSAAPYAAAMRALAARLDGRSLVTVAVHDDLTMSNVLVGSGGLGIVDWEAARAADLPLLDLWYALADGLARARGIAHLGAVEILCGDARDIAPAIDGLPAEHAEALGLSPDQAQFGFHACWVGHADDELRRGAPGPFVAIVEALAKRVPGR